MKFDVATRRIGVWTSKATAMLKFSVADIAARQNVPVRPKTLLVLRLDSIGDYVLFRNHFESIRSSARFKDYELTFCGNTVVRELAEGYDRNVVDSFIWIERDRFVTDRKYRMSVLKDISARGFEIVLNAAYSRESLFTDSIVRVCGANEKIGYAGDPTTERCLERRMTESLYDTLVRPAAGITFEFERTRAFLSEVLHTPLAHSRPELAPVPAEILPSLKRKIDVVLSVGAKLPLRRWDLRKFLGVCDQLHEEKGWTFAAVGGSKEELSGYDENAMRTREYLCDGVGRWSLLQTIAVIRQSRLLVSNDTGIAHIGIAVGVPTIVISNGNHFGRFTEYPAEMERRVTYVYPPAVRVSNESFRDLVRRFAKESNLDINSIQVEDCINAVKGLDA